MNAPEPCCKALILAGSRGAADPVARHAGRVHKALVPLDGVPMLVRVVRALRAWPAVSRISICLDDRGLVEALPEVRALVAAGEITLLAADTTPSGSVLRALRELHEPLPLLVTTADHPLLTVAMLRHFYRGAPADADLAVAVATASVIRATYPDSVRTFFRLGWQGYSGCNLFLFRTPAAARVATLWLEFERYRKQPLRLLAIAGLGTAFRYLAGLLSLDAALARLSALAGATVKAVEMPFAEAAIDVDRPADLELAERILRRRAQI